MTAEREEKLITTVAWMYEVRRAARAIYGQNYAAKIEPAKDLLSAYAEHHGISCIAAVPQMIAEIGDATEQERNVAIMQLTSAAVEISEEAK